jgi:putative FmdB family regulatory protein
MPIYEYECRKCRQRHEIMQKMSDSPLTTCVVCGGEVYRIISPSGLSFKGEGWYITDYARKGKDSDPKNSGTKTNLGKETATPPLPTPSTTTGEKETTRSPSPEKTSEKKRPAKRYKR